MKENWFTPNFKNGVHQQRKALKSTRFLINQKSVYTSQNEGFLEKCNFTGPKNCFCLNKYLKKLKKTVSTTRNKILLNISLSLTTIVVSEKVRVNEYCFHKTKTPLILAVIMDSFKIYFHEMENLPPVERIFQKLEQGFHSPKNQFPLARIKDLLKNMVTLGGKKPFNCQAYLNNGEKIVSYYSQKICFRQSE